MEQTLTVVCLLAAGLYAGGSVFISLVSHPARLSGDDVFALEHIRREHDYVDKVLPIFLLIAGCLSCALWYWGERAVAVPLYSGVVLLLVVPYSIAIVGPTLTRLLDRDAKYERGEVRKLISRWGKLHGLRAIAGTVALWLWLTVLL